MKAIIFGITGQDGSYLAELLLEKGYEVVGITRRVSVPTLNRINHILPKIKIVEGDITDAFSVSNVIKEEAPDEIYNLAAQSHVGTSFKQPSLTWPKARPATARCVQLVMVPMATQAFLPIRNWLSNILSTRSVNWRHSNRASEPMPSWVEWSLR